MTAGQFILLETKTRDDASDMAAQLACAALTQGIGCKRTGRILLSGGSTPEDAYRRMSRQTIDWNSVQIGLVDERYVSPTDPASNQTLLERTLLTARASSAAFIPLWSQAPNIEEAADQASKSYKDLLPADFALFGMGTDGHTASWFPGADGLEDALSPDAPAVVPIHAPNANPCAQRLTMTLPALSMSDKAVLLIFGKQKLDVLLKAAQSPAPELPVRALLDALGVRLTVIWAP